MKRALLLAALASGLGCGVQRGAWRADNASVDPPQAALAKVSLVLIGNGGAPTRWAKTVAAGLDARLVAEHDAGREPIVLWLGGLAMPRHPDRRRPDCPSDPALASREGAAKLSEVVQRHVERGHQSYAVAGIDDWACGSNAALIQKSPSAGPNPWAMPDQHFVVRVRADGSSRVVSHCTEANECSVEQTSAIAQPGGEPEPLVDLVVLDTVPWIAPPRDADDRRRKDAAVARMDALLAAVLAQADAPPRILVSSVPIEAAGYNGMGGGGSTASYHYLPPSLQAAVEHGVFAGSIGSHDRASYAHPDISNGVKRSSRGWLRTPVFQVVSGTASLPDSRPGSSARRLRYYRSNSYEADAYSDRAGFAVVFVSPTRVDTVLYAAWAGRWQTAVVQAPLDPEPHPVETPSGPLNPCLRCENIPVPDR